MVTEFTRSFILKKDKDLRYCSLVGQNLNDEELIELAILISQNPYITYINLDNNPKITQLGAKRFMDSLPNITVANCDCFKSFEQIMEESTLTRKPLVAHFSVICSGSRNTENKSEAKTTSDNTCREIIKI